MDELILMFHGSLHLLVFKHVIHVGNKRKSNKIFEEPLDLYWPSESKVPHFEISINLLFGAAVFLYLFSSLTAISLLLVVYQEELQLI